MDSSSPEDAGKGISGTVSIAMVTENPTDATETSSSAPAVSKNQLKRLRKQEHRQLAKQAKKVELRKRKLGDVDGNSTELAESTPVASPVVLTKPQYIINDKTKNERKLREAEEHRQRCDGNFSVIIDCAWEDKHSEATLKSLTQQIMFCYGANRKHDCPAAMYLTGVGPLVSANLNKSNFRNWLGVTVCDGEYLTHPDFQIDAVTVDNQNSGKKQLVYLTSDAEETLETLDPSCAYIIGGIVDRNRHKFATFNKAKAQGVRTAKLPIKENFALAATHILTVNHVLEILLNYAKYKCWVRAIKEVMPNRKCPVEKGETSAEGAAALPDGGAEPAAAERPECDAVVGV
jgi:tRNA (guanine9-N1)-methyltransferase